MTLPVLPAPALLVLARGGLAEAAAVPAPGQRYALAHLAALRAAAAVLACRAQATPVMPTVMPIATPIGAPTSPVPARRSRPTSAWVLLAGVAPELAEWAAFFAAGARKRAAAEAGLAGVVTPREADDLLRDAQSFLAVIETTLAVDPAGARTSAAAAPSSRPGRARPGTLQGSG